MPYTNSDLLQKLLLFLGLGVESKLITAESRKGYFYYDYVVQPEGQPKRHLLTIFTVLGEEQVLATFTAQCLEEQYEAAKPTLDAIAASFKFRD